MEVRWAPSAVRDLERIFDKIRKDNPAAAERVIRTIYEGCAALVMFPERGGGRDGLRGVVNLCSRPFPISRCTGSRSANKSWRFPASITVLRTGPKVARKMRTGQVDINGGRYNPLAPFGGYKQSGVGRELGVFGLEEYLQVKSIAR
jgi:plasmid stabilization system protein ParE